VEEATVHAVDGLAGTPELIFVLGILAIIAVVLVKVVPMWRDLRQAQIDNEAQIKQAQVGIERDRELRKTEEARQRAERERENAAIMSRSVDAQERSTAAMGALTQQMAVMNGQLELSKDRSAQMGERIDVMAGQIGDVHRVVVIEGKD